MGFTTVNSLITESVTNGKSLESFFYKTSGLVAYTAGKWYDTSMWIGSPRQNLYPGCIRTSIKLDYTNNGNIYNGTLVNTGETKHITKVFVWATAATAVKSTLMLCDYLMYYPAFDMGSNNYQSTITNIALPRYSTGENIDMLLITTNDTGLVPNVLLRVTYTNSLGVPNRLSQFVTLGASSIPTNIPYTGITGGVSNGPFIPLQERDTGVQSVQGIQLSQGTGLGFGCIVLVKPLLYMQIRSANATTEKDFFLDIPTIPKIKDEAFLSWLCFTGGALVASSLISGGLEFSWGNS